MIDMHVHVSASANLERDRTLSDRVVEEEVEALGQRLRNVGTTGALVILMDMRFADRPEVLERLPRSADGVALDYCLLFDVERPDADAALDRLAGSLVRGIKVHPYLQGLERSQLPLVERLSEAAGTRGLFVLVDGEYGSRHFYRIRPGEVVLRMAERTAMPVLFAHGGGAAVLDAMVIAEACTNVFLDLSFSLGYWHGSSAEADFAFAIRKLGPERWMYGSDAPFVPLDQARATFDAFVERFGFSRQDAETMLAEAPRSFWEAVGVGRGVDQGGGGPGERVRSSAPSES